MDCNILSCTHTHSLSLSIYLSIYLSTLNPMYLSGMMYTNTHAYAEPHKYHTKTSGPDKPSRKNTHSNRHALESIHPHTVACSYIHTLNKQPPTHTLTPKMHKHKHKHKHTCKHTYIPSQNTCTHVYIHS